MYTCSCHQPLVWSDFQFIDLLCVNVRDRDARSVKSMNLLNLEFLQVKYMYLCYCMYVYIIYKHAMCSI